MKDVLKIAGTFVGFLAGAGFASGQEILQFFVNFGVWGLAGMLISTMVFVFLGMALASMGSRLQATSHKEVVYAICGSWFGPLVDGLITFFTFAIAVVMLAGAGALLEQQFGLTATLGSALATLLVVLATCLKLRRVIALISGVTPLLVLVSLGIAGYAVMTRDVDLATLDRLAEAQVAAASHWWLGALLYVSYNIFGGIAILAIAGGSATNARTAAWGGVLGGLMLGGLMFVIGLALLSRLDSLTDAPMPMLLLANEISSALSLVVALVILGMVLNTAVGALYSFSARFLTTDTPSFSLGAAVFGLIAYGCSLVGFINLVGMVYPIFGYIGFFLMATILFAWVRQRQEQSPAAMAVTIQQEGQ